MRKLSKIKLIASLAGLIIVLMAALVVNLNSGHPLFRTIVVSNHFNRVIFNNYDIKDTLEISKKSIRIKGDIRRSYIIYNYVLKKDPNNISAYIGISDVYGTMKNFNKSKEYFSKAETLVTVNTKPEELVDLYYMCGMIYDSTFSYEGYKYTPKAIEYFEKALNIHALNPDWEKKYASYIYLHLGAIYSSLERSEEACKFFQKSIENDTSDQTVYYAIATAYIELKEYEKAYHYLEKYKNIFGENGDYLLGMAFISITKEDYKTAIIYLDKAKNITDNLFTLNFYYGKYYEKTKNIKAAKESYRKAIEANIYSFNELDVQEVIKRLNINFDDIKQRIEKEKEENYSKTLE